MSESIHPPVKQPNLTRTFAVTDMPTGLMAALVTRPVRTRATRRGQGGGGS
jgi:hypothetical protein